MKVIPFEEKYRQDFIDFNTEWIISNFGFLEEHDKETFEKIDDEMKLGAMIFFAVENDVALATCMAMPMQGTTWEICKLGSNKNVPHKGAGSAVFEAAMKWALNHGAERLFILSNSKLKPALHIYRKYGFEEIKLENYEYVSAARASVSQAARMLALTLAPGICVNTVNIGAIDTGRQYAKYQKSGSNLTYPEWKRQEAQRRGIPMERIGTVEEVVPMILMLLSPLSSYITALAIDISGGVNTR